jgi:23S rRNA (cytosine1962-C5)-methyltransferase
MTKITLKKNEDRRVRNGHPWIFSNEIAQIDGDRSPGSAAEVRDAGGGLIGCGHYNPRSLIAVRLLSTGLVDLDSPQFYRERIARADALRHALYPELTTYRAVYGESDFLPGLVVDRYHDRLSVQFLSAGMDCRRALIIPALVELFAAKGIVARNDVAVRGLEGLEETVEVLHGDIPETIEIDEHGLRFQVNLLQGQKTGHFLDQKDNHLMLREICAGKEVLDCFCYSGSWGVHAASYGAASVVCLDVSERAIGLARQNAALNGLEGVFRFEAMDAFDRLRSMRGEGKRFDVIVLDPPAFVKSRKTIKEAQKGYLTVNRRAMELLRDGGHLITCSCSYHMEREMFRDTLVRAAQQAGRRMRLVASRSQAADHPVLLGIPETEYLKCHVLQAI